MDVCVSAGTLPIIARFGQTGETLTGEVTYQGVPIAVTGRLSGRMVRLEGSLGAQTADPAAPRFEIREWRTEFDAAHEMSGGFTLVVAGHRDGVPTEVSLPIIVTRLVRANPG